MAGGTFMVDGPAGNYGGGITVSVIITCIVAASGGLIFGYDIGISGGVSTMESFLKPFFPSVLRKMRDAKQDVYCIYDSQILTAFTSSLYLAGMVASLVAGRLTKAIGRKMVMVLGGATFFVGAALNAGAVNIEMLILGRMLLGFGVGFTNQAAPVYLAETAPAKWRGAFTAGFSFFIAIGVVTSNLINYGTARIAVWGWRLSLGLAAVPAAIIFFGAFLIPDTPSSLVQRGKHDAARAALRRIRGRTADVEGEIMEIERTVEESNKVEQGAFRRIVQRRYRPYLVMSVAIPLFTQLTGVVIIAFFSPMLFQTVGFGSNASLMAAVILGAVNLGSNIVSAFTVDRFGRKVLFMAGGAQMILCQVAVAWILGEQISSDGQGAPLPRSYAVAVLVLLCAYSAGFGWSWGPLSFIVPGEIFPVEIRSAGQSISVAVSLAATFVQSQFFLSMLCSFKEGTYGYYAGWIVIMTAFTAVFLPETKGVPLGSMAERFERHWYWARFFKDEKELRAGGRVAEEAPSAD